MSIDGRKVSARNRFPVIDPATGQSFIEVPDATREQLDAAVTAAQSAFGGWSTMPPAERRARVLAFVDTVSAEAESLAEIVSREQGKPLAKARSSVASAVSFARGYADIDLKTEILRDTPRQRVELRRRPLGVVGAITAWNYPVLLAMWKIAPALLAGNTMVLKPSPYTPVATLHLGELAQPHFPPGVLNVISGNDPLGAWMCEHPGIRKIAFTGSVATGRRVMASASVNIKRLTLELGGNDAGIVLDDVDPRAIATNLFWAKFSNCGQVCAGLKRLYVPRALLDRTCDALSEVASSVRLGPGHEPEVDIGPIQNRAQFDRVCRMVDAAVSAGARIRFIGEVPRGGRGYFYPVTLLSAVPAHAEVLREELFGPVLSVQPYDDIEEALRLANDSEYGLGGSVWGTDIDRATELALRLETGSAWVNQHPSMGADIPFGGIKSSSLGVELGRLGLEEYTSVQVVNVCRPA